MLVQILLLVGLSKSAIASRCAPNEAVFRFELGNIKGTIVSDGPILTEPNDSTFSVPTPAVRRSYSANFRPFSDTLVWQQNVAVLDTPSGRVVADVGSANLQFLPTLRKAGKLFTNLREAGIAPESVDAVLLTHAHLDHVAGLVTADVKAAFPNAKVYISRREHEFWNANPIPTPNPNLTDEIIDGFKDIYLRSIAPYADRLVLVPNNGSPLPGISFLGTPGHSPGHSAIKVKTGKGNLIISGDTWVTAPDQLQNPEWGYFFETDRLTAFKSRVRLLTRAARTKELVLAYHEHFPGLGYVTQSGPFFDWKPAAGGLLDTERETGC